MVIWMGGWTGGSDAGVVTNQGEVKYDFLTIYHPPCSLADHLMSSVHIM